MRSACCFSVATLVVWQLLFPSGACSQGQLIFDNHVNNVVVAPVYGFDPAHPTLVVRGNTASGYPHGSQTYTSAPLGAGYTAQLFGGPTHAATQNLQPLRPATAFHTGAAAGFIVAPATTIAVPGVPEGAFAKIQLRAWQNRNGTVTNWAQVLMDPTIPHGESWAILTGPLGGPFLVPPNLIGLESFNLVTGSAARVSIKIHFQPADIPAPAGYDIDSGLVYGPRGGQRSFGWNQDLRGSTYVRFATDSPDAVHDSFLEIPPDGIWNIELNNGLYGVHVTGGDPELTTGLNGLLVQDTLLQAEVAPAVRWLEAEAIVEVLDGRMTLRGSPDSVFNRICAIEIVPLSPVRLQGPLKPTREGGLQVRFSGEAGFPYQLEVTSDFVTWQPAGSPGFLGADQWQFTTNTAAGEGQQFFRARVQTGP